MKTKKLRVGVIFGGRSAEHEVSLVSAASVMANLDKRKYEVVPIGITKDGRWIAGQASHKLLTQGAPIPAHLRAVLPPEPQTKALVPFKSPKTALKSLNCIIPVLHGTYGEDGTVQGLLELTGIPYVGSGVLGSAVGMDKILQKIIFQNAGIPTANFVYATSTEYQARPRTLEKLVDKQIGFPCFVKPPNLGSSVGITKVHNKKELTPAIKLALSFDRKVIIERSVEHAWEIECAVLGNDTPNASIAGRIESSNEFYDYDAKYVDGKSQAVIPAKLPRAVMAQVKKYSVAAFKVLDLAGMARVDFLIQPKTWRIYINEVNTIPGFTSISMYPKLWEASGLNYPRLLDKLISLAISRARDKEKLKTAYRPREKWYRSS